MNTEIANAVVSALGTILISLIGYVAKQVADYLKAKTSSQDMDKKLKLAKAAVGAAEQVWQNVEGPERLEVAKDAFIDMLNDEGIKITERQVDVFLEAAVKEMNDAFNSTKVGVIELSDLEEEK